MSFEQELPSYDKGSMLYDNGALSYNNKPVSYDNDAMSSNKSAVLPAKDLPFRPRLNFICLFNQSALFFKGY